MEIGHIIPHIEAMLFASDKPLTPIDVTELINNAFGFMEDKITMEQVQTAIEGIVEKYASEFYPFELRESGGGWQFLTKKDYHKTVAQLNGEKYLKRLSAAALETLAIIAYKQPITKADIEAIRGVSCDYSIQKLLEKELIIISGRNEELPGKPLIYNTSRNFMDYFGINSPSDLPKLKEVFAEAMVNPTIVNQAEGDTPDEPADGISPLIVNEDGELEENRIVGEEDSMDFDNSSAADDTEAAEEEPDTTAEENADDSNEAHDNEDLAPAESDEEVEEINADEDADDTETDEDSDDRDINDLGADRNTGDPESDNH